MHGGGCVIGDLETHDIFCRALCHDTGATVLSLDYRLAPEHPFPAAVEDTVAALTWLSHAAASLGLDAERIAIAGDSAGGGLAAVALHETKGALAAPVRAQALIYPALDLRGRLPSRTELAQHFPIPRDMIDWFFDHYFGLAWPFTDPRAIPSLYEDYTRAAAGADPHRGARSVARRGRGLCGDIVPGRRAGRVCVLRRHDPRVYEYGTGAARRAWPRAPAARGLARRAPAQVKANGQQTSATYDRPRSCSAEIRQ